jgi:outer membrane receptor protein involved in Fe transport
VRGGVRLDRYEFDHALTTLDDPDEDYLPLFDMRSSLTNIVAYLEDEWQPSERFRVRGGVRLLAAGRLGTALLPRLGARWQVTPSLAFTAGGGRYAQALRSLKDDESVVASVIAYDILAVQPDDAGLARGTDVIVGGEYTDRNTRVRVEAFAKQQDRLVLAAETENPIDARPLVVDDYRIGTGSARGLELSARRVAGRFDLGVSYALGEAERRAGADTFAPRFERRHQLDLSSGYRWGEAGLLSARLVLASGQPVTPAVGLAQPRVFDPVQQRWDEFGEVVVAGVHNSARLPGYVRLDVAACGARRRIR